MMPKYQIILTRDITESVVVEVEAENAEEAQLWAEPPADAEWEIDEGSWNNGDIYITGCEPIEGD
jgi:hypothetical protein